jgi:hypothetical protein
MGTKVYIYSLTDPITNEIRYIGKSINPNQRYHSHLSRSKEVKTHTNCWIFGKFRILLSHITGFCNWFCFDFQLFY